LFRPALFQRTLSQGETVCLVLTAEPGDPTPADQSLSNERNRQLRLLEELPDQHTPDWIEQLTLAADQFIVKRHESSAAAGSAPHTNASEVSRTVIAGYPWFSDWGRDTMIALPGLTLATRRYDIAADVLRTFARFVDRGMLPNRFPDAGETAEYNTVDATLWYFVAIDEYVRRSGDHDLVADLYPLLRDIIEWHRRGTRYGIGLDMTDGLLRAGEAGVQLTWMDAKIGDWVVTPRIGKPVEINALWFNALMIMRDLAVTMRDSEGAREFGAAAERAARSFNARFWFESGGYLYDVVDGPDGDDASLRPNQLFAVSLRHALLDNRRARSIVDVCGRELWTPRGMRSLAPSDPRYRGRYAGSPSDRDAVYHQGTVWSWLLGPFALAHYRVHRDAADALALLEGMNDHLREGCVGQISEIFDGDAPFAPRGCFAQAWSVAEILKAWTEINEDRNENQNRSKTRRAHATQ
jgi:predicted glycogen debranching enzyme